VTESGRQAFLQYRRQMLGLLQPPPD
jgi:hypothetical protein